MPTLHNLDCTILLPPTSTPLPEYRRRYLDSSVSAYVPVPVPALPAAQPFAIRLRADNWVAPGLAAFVFIDGIYHANRSKGAPLLGSEGGSAVEILLRQKEEKVAGAEQGMFVGREWRFGGLDVDQADKSETSSKNKHPNVGRIEVVVLRCDYEDEQPAAREKPYTTSVAKDLPTRSKPPTVRESLGGLMGIFDGASDLSLDGADDRHFSLDGQAYNHPGVIVNQYGQPYEPQVAYYQTPAGRQQGSKYYDNGRPVAARGEYQQVPIYTTNPVAFAPTQRQVYQGSPAAPAQGLFERVYTSPLPQAQQYTAQPPAPTAQQYVYAAPQYQLPASQPYQPRKIPVETQRQAIWTLGPPIGRHFGVHHRFLAAAAPFISVLRDNPVGRLNHLGREKVMQELRAFRDAGRFPDGTALHMLEDPLERERERDEKLKREILALVRAEKGERGLDEFGFERGSLFTRSDKSGRGEKKSEAGSKKTVEHFAADGKKGSTSNKSQSGNWWGDNNKGGNDDGGNNASAWGDPNNNNDNNGQQTGGWANNNDNNQNNAADNTAWDVQPADNAWDQANNNNNNQQPDAWGNASATKSKSKSKSKPSTTTSSTTTTKHSHSSKTPSTQTTNPHADIQPYFATWRDPQPLPHRPSTTPLPNPPLPPSARNPYTHPNAGADYVHRTYTPKYLDEMDRPFAVFVFKYRSVGKLGEILGRDVGGDVEGMRREVSRGVLMGLSRERLVEEVLRDVERRGRGGEGKKKTEKKKEKSDAGGDGWAKQSSGGRSKGGAAGAGWDAQPADAKNVQWDNDNNKQASVKNDGWGNAQNDGGWAQTGGGKTGRAQHEAGTLIGELEFAAEHSDIPSDARAFLQNDMSSVNGSA